MGRWVLMAWGVLFAVALWVAAIGFFSALGGSEGQPAGVCKRITLRAWDGRPNPAITNADQGGVHEISCEGRMWAIY